MSDIDAILIADAIAAAMLGVTMLYLLLFP